MSACFARSTPDTVPLGTRPIDLRPTVETGAAGRRHQERRTAIGTSPRHPRANRTLSTQRHQR